MIEYREIREQMKPGDVVAFSGKGAVSGIIKRVTRAAVSHIGVIRQTRVLEAEEDRYFNEICESTQLQGARGQTVTGVQTVRLSVRLAAYDGAVWWLPLSAETRARFNQARYFDWLYAQDGKPYDLRQAVRSGLDVLDRLPGSPTRAHEDFSRLFCSELAAGALEAAGVLPPLNASEVTPIDLVSMAIYGSCHQLRSDEGAPDEIPGWGTVPLQVVATRWAA